MSGIFNSPASMYVMLAGVEGEITASHLSMFSVRPCDVANSLTTLIWSWQSDVCGQGTNVVSMGESAKVETADRGAA